MVSEVHGCDDGYLEQGAERNSSMHAGSFA